MAVFFVCLCDDDIMFMARKPQDTLKRRKLVGGWREREKGGREAFNFWCWVLHFICIVYIDLAIAQPHMHPWAHEHTHKHKDKSQWTWERTQKNKIGKMVLESVYDLDKYYAVSVWSHTIEVHTTQDLNNNNNLPIYGVRSHIYICIVCMYVYMVHCIMYTCI